MLVVQSGKPRHLRLQDNPPINTSALPAESYTRPDVFFSTANLLFKSEKIEICQNMKRDDF